MLGLPSSEILLVCTWTLCSSFSSCSQTWLASTVLLSKSFTTHWCCTFSWADSSWRLGRGGEEGRSLSWRLYSLRRFTCYLLLAKECLYYTVHVCFSNSDCVCVCVCVCVLVTVCMCMHVGACGCMFVCAGRKNSSTLGPFLGSHQAWNNALTSTTWLKFGLGTFRKLSTLDYMHSLQPSLYPRERLTEEEWTKVGMKEEGGGRWGRHQLCWMLRELSPTKIDIASFLPFMLSGYGSSQHCLHTLMYNIHTHALTCSHTHTHTHYIPAVAVNGTSWAPCCAFSCSMLHMKHALVWKVCTPPQKKRKVLEFRISESSSVGYIHISVVKAYYGSQSTSSGPPDLYKE